MLVLVVALAAHRGIGRANTLPWPRPLRADMAWFRTLTQSAPSVLPTHIALSPAHPAVVMGRRTWDSIPARFRPLSGRTNIVVSRAPHAQDGAVFIPSLAALDSLGLPSAAPVFVIGGHDIYKLALESNRVLLIFATEVLAAPDCDVFFPHTDWDSYERRDITPDVARLIGAAAASYDPTERVFVEDGVRFKMLLYIKPSLCSFRPI